MLNKRHATTVGLTRLRIALTVFFAIDGFIFASWAVRIPAVRQQVAASPAALGLALLGASAGAVATMAITGRLCRRFGGRRVTTVAAGWLSLAALLPPLARSAPWLGLALIVFGIGYGGLNVAMNSVAVDLVAAIRRPVMPSFHAAWSLGGLAGSAAGGLAASQLSPLSHLALVAALGLAITAGCGRVLLTRPVPPENPVSPSVPNTNAVRVDNAAPFKEAVSLSAGPATSSGSALDGEGSPAPGRRWRVVALFGLIAMCGAYGEGAIADWGALHLEQDLSVGAGLAAMGYMAFALAEASGRLLGTRLLTRLGQTPVLVGGGLTAAAGMLIAALCPAIAAALAGFALTGLGVANLFPAAMSRAGLLAGPNGVAAASTLGYAGFLLGPPAIGFLASSVSLGTGLTTVSFLALLAAAFGYLARPKRR